jgi:hypothetical protein
MQPECVVKGGMSLAKFFSPVDNCENRAETNGRAGRAKLVRRLAVTLLLGTSKVGPQVIGPPLRSRPPRQNVGS